MTSCRLKHKQKRLDSCVLSQPKRTKIGEKFEDDACDALKIVALARVAHGRLENTGENRNRQPSTKLLGKYQLNLLPTLRGGIISY